MVDEKKEPLVARGEFVQSYDGKDEWTDPKTQEPREREFKAAVVQYMGGKHIIREPYDQDRGKGAAAFDAAFAQIKKGDEVAVSVRVGPTGRLELASLSGCVWKVA